MIFYLLSNYSSKEGTEIVPYLHSISLDPRVPASGTALEIMLAVWSIVRAATEVLREREAALRSVRRGKKMGNDIGEEKKKGHQKMGKKEDEKDLSDFFQ